jgi:hypothetical protein
MIDRKTALICAGLIVLMFAAAFWRILSPEVWPPDTAWTRTILPSVMLFVFPVASALVTGSLYWRSLRASADDPRFEPWQRWGTWVSISYCAGLSLLQCLLVAQSVGLHLPPALGRTLGVLMMIMAVAAINQMPKLPWFERRLFSLGGELGPIYGPRFMRILSKALIAFLIATFAFSFAAPTPLAERSFPYILVATALFVLWSIAWRIRLGRKWRLERAAHG